ncbi:uncharacterized protein EV154DRAFT_33635 [Mucor mucedo]|uniref:uncharacterized protein n=1 Tax=Mucor mucedo TaxID=29922 RepID=UPI00221ECEEA|nr:uncharacterized protein EV154DRAFT_33635 [Mucor mucedo]KAI7882317.1 hypothetical protein EV154DRAFT_33635 [Mucor mucedo]
MHKIISLSQKSDSLLFRLLNALPTEPQQQQAFGTLLSNHFEAYIECVHQLQPLIDTHNLATFRDMYNLNETIPSLLLEFDSHQYGVEDIHLIYSVICWKRREYLLYLLSLDVMSNHNRTHYGKTWRQAIQVNHGLVHAYLQFNEKLESMASLVDARVQKEEVLSVQTSPSSMTAATAGAGAEGLLSSSSHHSDSRSITLMHRVSALEKHVEDIQAKLFLCKQDTKSLSSGRVSWLGLERMNKRFSQIDEHMQIMIGQWEESKHALEEMLEDQQTKLDTIASLPSPPSSPRGLPTLEDKRTYQPFTVKRMHSFNNSKYKTRTETI